MPRAAPLRLLLSASSALTLEPRIRAIADAARLVLVSLDAAAANATLQVDASFISRDITGFSSKTQLSEPLRDCYAVLRRSPNLAWVHTHSAGADRPIYGELAAVGTRVTTSSGANAQVVAQTALAGLLALARRLPIFMAAQLRHEWLPATRPPLPRDLAGQTVVLVGWGAIGRALQPMLAAVGLNTIVVRRGAEPAGDGLLTVGVDRLHEVLPLADWLVLACPLTAQTRGLIDARALRALPPHACLVNVSRGEVVVEAALATALASGALAGAHLDVFEVEPLPAPSPLWDMPNVIITPHAAGHSDGHAARVAEIFLDNLRRWLEGRPMINEVERDA